MPDLRRAGYSLSADSGKNPGGTVCNRTTSKPNRLFRPEDKPPTVLLGLPVTLVVHPPTGDAT